MARILFAWELGTGYGHAHRMAVIARPLQALGHTIAVVTQEPALVRSAFDDIPAVIEAVPILLAPAAPEHYAASYAEVLLRCGFADPAVLGTRLDAWKMVLDRHRPDLLIVDFAPTAMLAARIAGLQVASVENGYTMPPATDPLPFTQAWATVAPGHLRALDSQALTAINVSMAPRGSAGLGRLSDLFDVQARFLCTFPELDHYQDRGPADYFGAVYADSRGDAPVWPDGRGPRVFAYVHGGHPAFKATVAALQAKGWPTVMHARGGGRSYDAGSVRMHAGTVRLARALAECDLVVCQGLATVSAALLAGRPVVQMADYLEQAMIMHQIVRQGLGVGVMRQAGEESVGVALGLVQDDAGFARRAAAFAHRYHGFTPALAAEAVAAGCAAMV